MGFDMPSYFLFYIFSNAIISIMFRFFRLDEILLLFFYLSRFFSGKIFPQNISNIYIYIIHLTLLTIQKSNTIAVNFRVTTHIRKTIT